MPRRVLSVRAATALAQPLARPTQPQPLRLPSLPPLIRQQGQYLPRPAHPRGLRVLPNVVSEAEAERLLAAVATPLRRMRYASGHFDQAIHGFRELRSQFTDQQYLFRRLQALVQACLTAAPHSEDVLQGPNSLSRPVQSAQLAAAAMQNSATSPAAAARPQSLPQLLSAVAAVPAVTPLLFSREIHVVDLQASGQILPHVDSIKFVGPVIAGISLNSPAIMRFEHEEDPRDCFEALLLPNSMYVMNHEVRYHYKHSITDYEFEWDGKQYKRDRRVSMIMRMDTPLTA